MTFLYRLYLLPLVFIVSLAQAVAEMITTIGDFISDGVKPW